MPAKETLRVAATRRRVRENCVKYSDSNRPHGTTAVGRGFRGLVGISLLKSRRDGDCFCQSSPAPAIDRQWALRSRATNPASCKAGSVSHSSSPRLKTGALALVTRR